MSFRSSGALAAACLACLSSPVLAHATLAVTEASPNSAYRGTIRIGHGCEGSPTTSVSVTIPEGVIAAKPMPKPGWTLAIETAPYARAYDLYHGTQIREGARTITWSGSALPDEHYDEFVFVARISDAFAPGAAIPFPIVQTCRTGEHRWTEVPAAGQNAQTLKSPAPLVRLVQAGGSAAPALAAAPAGPGGAVQAGPLRIESPWLRATPGGAKVAGGYLRITNTGPEADRLLSVESPIATGGEVHEMSRDGGVMKMREVTGGLAIGPGQTVELKPGGFHLMLTGLTGPLKEGERTAVTLVFARAGRVPVNFPVAGIGAQAAPAGDNPHAHH